jgi:hypothetical protein
MKRKIDRVYQFKVTLNDIRPPIWRRIQVPETSTFWDLHVAIQDAMGWLDYHLHEFTVCNPPTGRKHAIGIPGDEDFYPGEKRVYAGWRRKIADYFSVQNAKAEYVYDFGDDWHHMVRLEKILPREQGVRYPICLGGKRACPPEDCGGIYGYQEFLEIIMNPGHEDYEPMLEWVGGSFDPEHFVPNEIAFDDPQKRWKIAFEEKRGSSP